jgi:hypothetical protein
MLFFKDVKNMLFLTSRRLKILSFSNVEIKRYIKSQVKIPYTALEVIRFMKQRLRCFLPIIRHFRKVKIGVLSIVAL